VWLYLYSLFCAPFCLHLSCPCDEHADVWSADIGRCLYLAARGAQRWWLGVPVCAAARLLLVRSMHKSAL
jgi:hypothetical protein